MSTASPTAFLVWAILSVLFLSFLVYHLWCYDRFKCLHWSSGRQPGAFKRVMTYSYLAAVPLFVVYSVAMTVIKFREGFLMTPDRRIIPMPYDLYTSKNRDWILPLNFVFSFAWALELVTHLEELAFWLYLLHQNPQKEAWFNSWEYRVWYLGSVTAVLGMPLATLVSRRNIVTCDAWIFLVGSSGSTTTTLCFLYVLWCFPRFIRHVKSEGADPSVVVRLATFYQLNLVRVVFRFLFTVPLFILAIDGITTRSHPINSDLFWTDFLTMIAGIGCFVSTAITLLIFFPRSIVKESGYKPKPPTIAGSPKSPVYPGSPESITPRALSGAFDPSMRSPYSPQEVVMDDWDDDASLARYNGDQAPPYAGMGMEPSVRLDSPEPYAPPPQTQQYSPQTVVLDRGVGIGVNGGVHQRQPFPHSMSSPQILAPPPAPVPTSPQEMRVVLPPPPRHRGMGGEVPVQRAGLGVGTPASPPPATAVMGSTSTVSWKRSASSSPGVQFVPELPMHQHPHPHPHHQRVQVGGDPAGPSVYQGSAMRRESHVRTQSGASLHPYVMTFTSPIDLADLTPNLSGELPRQA